MKPDNQKSGGENALTRFDSVIMLTWSDWHNEPRSNRYHYATRFARHLPVYFVQPDLFERTHLLEGLSIPNINILHVGGVYDREGARYLDKVLKGYGLRRPLLWIYNVYFYEFILSQQRSFKVYHATETYFDSPPDIPMSDADLIEKCRSVLKLVDLVVAVSPGVAADYRESGSYTGRIVTIANGCDFDFWKGLGAHEYQEKSDNKPVVFMQGGINRRLDFQLIHRLLHQLPDWDFWFAGRVTGTMPEWELLLDHDNVSYFGEVRPERLAELARQVTVGLIAYRDSTYIRKSWPLKAFEYVACGLPVVSTPIDALESFPEIIKIGRTADQIASAIRGSRPTRAAAAAIDARLRAAALNSYDRRFAELLDVMAGVIQEKIAAPRELNILVLYDDRSTHIMTVREHLQAFPRHSKNNIVFLPASFDASSPNLHAAPPAWDFSYFDAVILHYAVRLSLPDYFLASLARCLTEYDGLKLLFIQDEYENVELARQWLDRLQFDTIFTCIPKESVHLVYPCGRFPRTEFIPTLTGYVPERDGLEIFAMPIEERKTYIGYRGRDLPPHYGELGREKFRIGADVRRFAAERGMPVDIELSSEKRIYGDDWYRFLGSCRATLGTESGSNIFDFTGRLQKLSQENSGRPYDEVYESHFKAHEGPVRMNQISPKVFEAIRLRTALVLFEGEYSGVVKPHEHYIPLKKDYSNIDDVFALLDDVAHLKELTERAYCDIILSGNYSYKTFVASVDRHIDHHILTQPRAELIFVPFMRRRRTEDQPELVPYRGVHDFALNTGILAGDLRRAAFADVVARGPNNGVLRHDLVTSNDVGGTGLTAARSVSEMPDEAPQAPARLTGSAGVAARLLPLAVRRRIAHSLKRKMDRYHLRPRRVRWLRVDWILWRGLPRSVRVAIAARLRAIT